MAYDADANYTSICNSLGVIIASVGGDETSAGSITYADLKELIATAHAGIGDPHVPEGWTVAQRTIYRSRQRKFDNARKFIYQRDLLTARNG
ncbi:MAG: hypothetical protein HOJ16_06465 [Candidatus Peribacter sp.]|jgi:hypothetical protein|nr:hypothetical protein [Candidatus Peribacter sp.]